VELDLWLGNRLVARTVSAARGGRVRIRFDEALVAEYPAETALLSCSLPLPGPGEPAKSRAFLEGLLPEGGALSTAAAQVRGVRLVNGSPEAAADAVALLAEFGRECAGAVVALPAGDEAPGSGHYEPLDSDALAMLIRRLPQHPLGTDLGRNIRMSLAGAQQKFLLARVDGRWCEPVGGAPSTHILKPTTVWPHSAENEALILALGRGCGLTDQAAWTESMGGTTVLVAERYDRRVVDGRITRLHQEDMCQAVGILPSQKYEIGSAGGRMARLLREFADEPRAAITALFHQLAFRAVVGDEDGHGKNYSLLLDEGHVSLAPLYDSLCTLVYPELTGTMATPIGAQRSLAKVNRQALGEEGRAMGMTEAEVSTALDALAAALRAALEDLGEKYTAGWPSEQVIQTVRARVDRLDAGEQLGSTAAARPRGGYTLDTATTRRDLGPMLTAEQGDTPVNSLLSGQ
jgi:serine/threonine-protein kinase HipA